ncbi:MAG TPA: S8 family serine peptidase, partial [Planctomycetia bacterium]|nr:S8 family serine peptidase [Planctomycetia bacterium]
GAVFLDGRRWSDPARGQGSNFGSGQFNASKPDISAPGVSIYSAHNRASSSGWTMTGTSMATPHVAGALALLRGQHPTVKVETLVDALAKSALPPSSSELGAGVLDVEKAEALLAGGIEPPIGSKPKPPINEAALRDLEDRIRYWESKGIKRID